MLAIAASAFAQETRGTIVGHVLDEQGAAMPGVNVTITNIDTNVSATLTTNSTGYYQAPLLLPGNYRVTAELQGFKTAVRNGIILSVAQQATVDVTLGVGAVSETVTVSGEAPILETGRPHDRTKPGSAQRRESPDVLEHARTAHAFRDRGQLLGQRPVCGAGVRQPYVERHIRAGRRRRQRMDDRWCDQQRQRPAACLFAELRHDRGSPHRDGELRRVVRAWHGPWHLDDDPKRHQPPARIPELSVPGTTSGTRRDISRSETTTPTSRRRKRTATRRWPTP